MLNRDLMSNVQPRSDVQLRSDAQLRSDVQLGSPIGRVGSDFDLDWMQGGGRSRRSWLSDIL